MSKEHEMTTIWTKYHNLIAAHRDGAYLGSVSRFASVHGTYTAERASETDGVSFPTQDEAKAYVEAPVAAVERECFNHATRQFSRCAS
jgi:hypothetical protein